MKGALVASFLLITPIYAWGAMNLNNCKTAWDSFSKTMLIAPQDRQAAASFQITQSDDGDCEVTPNGASLLGLTIDAVTFQVEDGTNKRKLEFTVTELVIEHVTSDVSAVLSHGTDTDMLIVDTLTVRGADGSGLRANGQFQLADFDSIATAQSAIAGIAVSTFNANLIVTPQLLAGIKADFGKVTRIALDRALRNVSQSQLDRASRQEILRFCGAAPQVRGTVAMTVNAQPTVSVWQMVAPFVDLPDDQDEAWLTHAIGIALSGLTLDLVWKPGRI